MSSASLRKVIKEVVIVEQLRGFANRLLGRQRDAGDEKRLRRDAEREGCTGRARPHGLAEPMHRRTDGGMLGGIQAPRARRGRQRPGQRDREPRQLG